MKVTENKVYRKGTGRVDTVLIDLVVVFFVFSRDVEEVNANVLVNPKPKGKPVFCVLFVLK